MSPASIEPGSVVKLIKVPPGLHDAASIGTPQVFQQALGREFEVMGLNEIGFVELRVTHAETIWVEPEFVELVVRPRTD